MDINLSPAGGKRANTEPEDMPAKMHEAKLVSFWGAAQEEAADQLAFAFCGVTPEASRRHVQKATSLDAQPTKCTTVDT